MTDRELMQQALRTIQQWDARGRLRIETALIARLAQPEPEPVGYLTNALGHEWVFTTKRINQYSQPVYYAPPQREFIGLTDEEIIDAADMAPFDTMVSAEDYIYVISRAIEAKLREKNS